MLLHGGVVDAQELVGRGYHVDAIGLALSALPVHELVHRLIGRRSLEDHAHHQEQRPAQGGRTALGDAATAYFHLAGLVRRGVNARKSHQRFLRACLKSSNEDGNEGKRENLSRNIKFAFTIFPKSAEFVEPAEKTLYHPAAWQNDKLV